MSEVAASSHGTSTGELCMAVFSRASLPVDQAANHTSMTQFRRSRACPHPAVEQLARDSCGVVGLPELRVEPRAKRERTAEALEDVASAHELDRPFGVDDGTRHVSLGQQHARTADARLGLDPER